MIAVRFNDFLTTICHMRIVSISIVVIKKLKVKRFINIVNILNYNSNISLILLE